MASRDDAVDEGMEEETEPRGVYRALATPAEAFRDTLTVRSYEVGRAGGAHPATILRYLEHLATCASAALGFDNRWYHEHHSAWVVREMSLLLGDAPRIDDALDLATWVADFRHVQATRDYLITRADSGRLVARASARWAYIHRERLLPTRIPVELTAREYEADSQQHINNCVYLDWLHEAAYQTAAQGALTGQPTRLCPRFYHLEYIRAAQPGEALTIATTAPLRARSRSVGFWQTISAADGLVARAWTECLLARE